MKARKTALYARVSSIDGSQTTENQFRALRELAKRARWRTVEFTDNMSGASTRRPQYQAMLRAAKNRELERIVVWKYDRFARSTSELILQLDEFAALGVDFQSITEQVDTSTPAGRMMFTMIAGFAEFERAIGIERTKEGMARARAKGKIPGRPTRIFDIDRARTLQAAGHGLGEIARIMSLDGPPVSRQTITRRLEKK